MTLKSWGLIVTSLGTAMLFKHCLEILVSKGEI